MKDEKQKQAAEEMYEALENAGIEVLLDDRDERPGVKFKDMELIGIPYRVTVGRGIADGKVELVDRSSNEKIEISVEECIERLKNALNK